MAFMYIHMHHYDTLLNVQCIYYEIPGRSNCKEEKSSWCDSQEAVDYKVFVNFTGNKIIIVVHILCIVKRPKVVSGVPFKGRYNLVYMPH